MRTFLLFLAILAALYAAACAALFFFQRSLIYFPQPGSGAPGAEMLQLPVDGGDVLVSTRPRLPPGAGAVLYFGGNAEDVTYSLPDLISAFPERAIYLLHYRGYGGSVGSPSEQALRSDAKALFDRIALQHPDIVVVGRSLGSGVAIQLAAERPVTRLVLVTPFDSLQDLAAQQFRLFPVRWLLADKYESGRHAARIKVPTTLIAAEHDEIIPRESTEQLHPRFAAGTATLRVIPKTGHNTISGHPSYLEMLRGD